MKICRAVLVIVLLIGGMSESLCAIVDETEPNNSPSTFNPLEPGDIGRGNIDPDTDFDFWRVSNSGGNDVGFFYVDTQGSTRDFDSLLKLYSFDGSAYTLVTEDDDGGPGVSSAITGVAMIPSFYFLDVRYGAGAGSSIYAITPYLLFQCLINSASSLSEVEPNDSPVQASALGPGMTTGSIGAADPADYFAFFATTGDVVALLVDTSPTGTIFGGNMQILAPDGSTVLADSGTPAKKAVGSVSITSSGRYFIRVVGGLTGGADYRFALNVNGACDTQAADAIFRNGFE
jgi:hypothetical protein